MKTKRCFSLFAALLFLACGLTWAQQSESVVNSNGSQLQSFDAGAPYVSESDDSYVQIGGVQTYQSNSSNVNNEIIDAEEGTGNTISVKATNETITVCYYYEKEGCIKIADPYHGRKTDDGWSYARGGEILIGEIAWKGKNGKEYSESFTVPRGGIGPAVFVFRNPSQGRRMNIVVRAIVKNDPTRTVLYPGIGCQYLLFARRNDSMPKETEYLLTFIVEGDGLYSVDPQYLTQWGWEPSLNYWMRKDPRLFGKGGQDSGLYK